MSKLTYSKEELFSSNVQRTFNQDASEAAFLLGGIGTGNVSIGARGELRDWEIFNRPGKGNRLPYTFFSIRAQEEGKAAITKVLESRIQPPYTRPRGYPANEGAGLPRLEKSVMRGEYPFVWIDFEDNELPVQISLEAYTPFIPLNPEDSGIPCAILRYKIKNKKQSPVELSIVGSLCNAVGYNGVTVPGRLDTAYMQDNKNEYRTENGIAGLYMYSEFFNENDIRYGNMCLMTPEENVTIKPYWLEGHWWEDGFQDFWNDFCEDGLLEYESSCQSKSDFKSGIKAKVGSIGIPCTLKEHEERIFTFILSWYFPNRVKAWSQETESYENISIVKNYYSKLFKDSWDVGSYIISNFDKLEQQTRSFHNAFFTTTLPSYVLEAASGNITVLRSPTCIWLEDGTFAAWEGCDSSGGCCPGSCTHVWNYTQTIAFLFPSLERSMRNVEMNKETKANGKMAFRTFTIFDKPAQIRTPATDGQMGTIIRLYREWIISGDNEFLRSTWDGAKRALDFAFSYWDSDGDYVLDSEQHNTYDIEFYGPNSLTNSLFFAALKAGEKMADAMNDNKRAHKYREAWQKGSKKMDQLLWNGEYYIQKLEDVNEYKYQYGIGCLADQLFGQFMSHVVGLGYILPEEHVKKAIQSVFKYNFMNDLYHHHSTQRTYALNDEKGLLLCSWPKGGRPRLPFIYSDEVWTGIEYQVAAHLIYEGYINEGLTIVKAVRERHDGYRRNPWNEFECGYHYARSMSSWAVLLALTGFQCNMVNKEITFSPKINKEDFSGFWSTGIAWGVFTQKLNTDTGKTEKTIKVLYGDLEDVNVIFP